MSNRGPVQTYEVTWRTGAIDRVSAHQVTHPGNSLLLITGELPRPARVRFHAEIDGQWTLILDALEEDILAIRNVTQIQETF